MDFDQYLLQLTGEFTTRINAFLAVLHTRIVPIIGVLLLIHIASKILHYYSNLDKGLDPLVIIRPCITLVIIVLYGPLVDLVLVKPARFLNQLVIDTILNVSGGDITAFNASFFDTMRTVDNNIFNVLQLNPILELIHLVLYFIAGFIANYMLLRQVINIAIYHILGYFAVLFSLIPGNENSLKTWLFTYLAILLWAPFIFIIKFLAILTRIDSTSFSSFLAVIAIQISLIYLFTKVPAFCETLVSTGNPISSPLSGSPIDKAGQITGGIKSGVKGVVKLISKAKSKLK